MMMMNIDDRQNSPIYFLHGVAILEEYSPGQLEHPYFGLLLRPISELLEYAIPPPPPPPRHRKV